MRLLYISLLSISILWLAFPWRSYANNDIVINEFLPHPSDDNKEWVEFYIPDDGGAINYWIDDDLDFTSDIGSSSKKQMNSFIQGSDVYHVVFELPSSILNNTGDTIALFTPEGTLVDQHQYTDDAGVDSSIGRTPDKTGDFHVLSFVTRGGPNSPPKPTATPTPLLTEKPTKEPKSTNPPKSEKSTTTENNTREIESYDQSFPEVTAVDIKRNNAQTTKARGTPRPTSILGISTKSAEKKATSSSTKSMVVKKAKNTTLQISAIIIGGVLLIACGILIYVKRRAK